jgi:hypothetical protein
MTWEDDALKTYQTNKAKKMEENKIASQRTQLLDKQSPHQWSSLIEAFENGCNRLNAKAGQPILRLATTPIDHLKIFREDRAKVEGLYVPDTRKATFSSDVFPFAEFIYELVVRPIDGDEVVVWHSLATNENEQVEDIVEAVLSRFLRGKK